MEDDEEGFKLDITCDQCGKDVGDEPTSTCGDCEWVMHKTCLPEHRKQIHAN